MQENLLQFIWAQGHYNAQNLVTLEGESLEILFPGTLNTHQGPDFLAARIRLNGQEWTGNVELHVRSSDWIRHGHTNDPHYRHVLLHVVWQHDDVTPGDIPILELSGRVPGTLLNTYASWMFQPESLPCAAALPPDGRCLPPAWKQALLKERISQKSSRWLQELDTLQGHWEELCWRKLARNFGHRVNADAFEELARSLPWKIIARHRAQIHQLEALLFGQSGMLRSDDEDPYPVMLRKEYAYLRKLYQLQPMLSRMQFLRMRPGNFPTVRLAQLAALINEERPLFGTILDASTLGTLTQWLDVTANDFWHYHYRFGKSSGYAPKRLGTEMVRNLIVNTVVPLVYAYGLWKGDPHLQQKSLGWLAQLPPEGDQSLFPFRNADWMLADAADSQALHELWKNYCMPRRCLDCAIGKGILTQGWSGRVIAQTVQSGFSGDGIPAS